MKRLITTISFLSIFGILTAQNYTTLRFTAEKQGQTTEHAAIDSITITNNTNHWTYTLVGDTVLKLVNSTSVQESATENMALSLGGANPFRCNTLVKLQLANDEPVTLRLYDLSGKLCYDKQANLATGTHQLLVEVAAAQLYLLSIGTSHGSLGLKMLASEAGMGFDIDVQQQNSTPYRHHKADVFDKPFQTTNSMTFTCYLTHNGSLKVQSINQSNNVDQTLIHFTIPTTYTVGSLYYGSDGEPEGIVCMLSDTLYSVNGIVYGSHGKMLSLDQELKQWGTGGVLQNAGANDSLNGQTNTDYLMLQITDTSSQYPFPERLEAVVWCTSKGNGWYFPAIAEVADFCEKATVLNPTLRTVSSADTVFDEQTIEVPIYVYYSSTAKDYLYVYSYDFGYKKVQTTMGISRAWVRAMKWF